MIKVFQVFFLFFMTSQVLSQNGILTENDATAEELVKNIFIKGNCKNVSNVRSIGSDTVSYGEFRNGSDVIDLDGGIIITSGKIDLAHGPNVTNESSFSFNDPSNDPDLNALATGLLFDVRGIEFDFVPLDDNVAFRYVFASEEYCEFVGTSFNDVFGFFVSGPGINGPFADNAINVATLTGSNLIVSINNVNHLENSEFYVGNETNIDAEACNIEFSSDFQDLIEYDGFTVPLTASFPVIPCETYHIRLIVGDVGDPNLDSAVFLEAKSFDLGEKASIAAEVPGSEDVIAYEGCVDGQYVFTRNASSDINEACTVDFSISNESQAVNGVDFEEISTSITIPAGETEAILPITIIEDNFPEGVENLKLEFIYPCDCFDPVQTELFISEKTELIVDLEDQIACLDQSFFLSPEISGGVAPYDFLWNNNETTDSIEITIGEADLFSVAVTDLCGDMEIAIANIDVQTVPIASMEGNYDLCEIQMQGIPVQLEGQAPWNLTYSIDGAEQATIENIQTSPLFLPSTAVGLYELISFYDSNCEGIVIGNTAISNSSIFVETSVTQPSCIQTFDGSIEITNIEAISPFNVSWNIETEDDFFVENLNAGIYTLLVEDGDGCIYEESFDLSASANDISECAPLFIPNVFTPDGLDGNSLFSIYAGENSGIQNIINMQIYDRWGSLVYERDNFFPDNGVTGWDGQFNGQAISPGLYVYKLEISFTDGSKANITGDVSLIR